MKEIVQLFDGQGRVPEIVLCCLFAPTIVVRRIRPLDDANETDHRTCVKILQKYVWSASVASETVARMVSTLYLFRPVNGFHCSQGIPFIYSAVRKHCLKQ